MRSLLRHLTSTVDERTQLARFRANFAKVISGQFSIALLNFGALSVNTSALGLSLFGVLVIIQSISELTSRFFAFQTWQAVNRFGARDRVEETFGRLRRLYRFALLLDTLAAVLATFVGIFLFLLYGRNFGLTDDQRGLAVVYALSSLFLGTSASMGLLRLTGRFGLAVSLQVLKAALLFLNAITLAALDAPLSAYVYTIAFITAATSMVLVVAAFLRANVLVRDNCEADCCEPIPRLAFTRFSLAASASGSVSALKQRSELLIVAVLLGPAGAAAYGVAQRVATIMSRFADSARQAVYPELADLVSRGDIRTARWVVARTSGLGLIIAFPALFVAWLFGREVISVVFGADFGIAYYSVLWLLVAYSIPSALFALGPFTQIIYGAGRMFLLALAVIPVFAAAAFAGPYFLGMAGAGMGIALNNAFLYLLVGYHTFILRPPHNMEITAKSGAISVSDIGGSDVVEPITDQFPTVVAAATDAPVSVRGANGKRQDVRTP